MSRIGPAFEGAMRLSAPAAEEAHRFGHPAVDVEHVLLALLVSQMPAGDLLRGRGISLDQARRAVQEQHAERIATLGIPGIRIPPRPIPSDGPRDIGWNDRAMRLFSRSGDDGTGLALLRALITDDGRFVADVLERLDVNPESVLEAIERTATTPPAPLPDAPPPAGMKQYSHESFVPAPPDEVWELLDTPERRPEWDSTIDTIEPDGENRWIGRVTDERSRAPRRGRLRTITLLRREEGHLLEWEHRLPLARRDRPFQLLISLDEQTGGTRLRLTTRWTRPVVPLPRFLFTIMLAAYAQGVSRALRS